MGPLFHLGSYLGENLNDQSTNYEKGLILNRCCMCKVKELANHILVHYAKVSML